MQHNFDIELAKKYGLNEAIVLNNFYFWIEKNRANGKHYHDGYYWTYNSASSLTVIFPYLNKRQIEYTLKKLKSQGLIVTGNYNESPYDRTNWYAITEKGYSELLHTTQTNIEQSTNENEQMEVQKSVHRYTNFCTPIPDINTDINKRNIKEKSTNEENEKKEPTDDVCLSANADGDNFSLFGAEDESLEVKNEQEAVESIPTASNSDTCMSDLEAENKQEAKTKTTVEEENMAHNFGIIWNAYPRKEGKIGAYKHYKTLIKGRKILSKTMKFSNDEILLAVKTYAKDVAYTDMQYIAHGSTFFNTKIVDYLLKAREELGEYDE